MHTPRGADILARVPLRRRGPRADVDAGRRSPRRRSPRCARRSAPTEHVICGLSGGVDSSVAAVLCHQALGDRLTCIFVDNGLLRQGEAEQVVAHVPRALPPEPRRASTRASASSARSRGVTDPGAEAQDHRPRLHRGLRGGGEEGRGRALARAGHALPGRHRERLVQGAERGHQEPPQRRRPARADEARSSSSRCASSSRTRCAPPARRSGCRATCSGATRSPGRASPSAASARSPRSGSRCCARPTRSSTEEIRAGGPLRRHLAGASRCSCPCGASASWATSAPTRRRAPCARCDSVDGMTADWAQLPYDVLGAHLEPHHQRGARHQPRRATTSRRKPPGDDRVGVRAGDRSSEIGSDRVPARDRPAAALSLLCGVPAAAGAGDADGVAAHARGRRRRRRSSSTTRRVGSLELRRGARRGAAAGRAPRHGEGRRLLPVGPARSRPRTGRARCSSRSPSSRCRTDASGLADPRLSRGFARP